MSLIEYLKGWHNPIPSPKMIPEEPLDFSLVARKWIYKMQNLTPKAPNRQDLEMFFSTIKEQYQVNGTINGLPVRLLRKVPWVVFSYPQSQPGELANDFNFSKEYLVWLTGQTTSSALSILFQVFMYRYPMNLNTFITWRDGIKNALWNAGSLRLKVIKERCEKYYLLENDGAMKFSQLMENSSNPVEILKEAGFEGQLNESVFVKRAYFQLLMDLQVKLNNGQPQSQLLEKTLVISSDPKGSGLRYPSLGKYLANALLMPYAERKASETHRQRIQDYLLGKMRDPRIVQTGWVGVDDRAKQVMYGWLVETSLEVFFDILSKTADTTWQKRKVFWSRYLTGGYIKEAWVILGGAARGLARIHFKDLGYGNLRGAAANQSVLLMRIDSLIIAEWSHSGACRFFSQTNATIPELYQKYYDRQELYGTPNLWIRHDPQGNWMNSVRVFIYNNTNIKI